MYLVVLRLYRHNDWQDVQELPGVVRGRPRECSRGHLRRVRWAPARRPACDGQPAAPHQIRRVWPRAAWGGARSAPHLPAPALGACRPPPRRARARLGRRTVWRRLRFRFWEGRFRRARPLPAQRRLAALDACLATTPEGPSAGPAQRTRAPRPCGQVRLRFRAFHLSVRWEWEWELELRSVRQRAGREGVRADVRVVGRRPADAHWPQPREHRGARGHCGAGALDGHLVLPLRIHPGPPCGGLRHTRRAPHVPRRRGTVSILPNFAEYISLKLNGMLFTIYETMSETK